MLNKFGLSYKASDFQLTDKKAISQHTAKYGVQTEYSIHSPHCLELRMCLSPEEICRNKYLMIKFTMGSIRSSI